MTSDAISLINICIWLTKLCFASLEWYPTSPSRPLLLVAHPPDVSACPMDLVSASLPVPQTPSNIPSSTSPTFPCTPVPSTASHATSSYAPPPSSSLPPVTVPPPPLGSGLHCSSSSSTTTTVSTRTPVVSSSHLPPAPPPTVPISSAHSTAPLSSPVSTAVPTLCSISTAPPASIPTTSAPSSITTLAPYVTPSPRKTTAQPRAGSSCVAPRPFPYDHLFVPARWDRFFIIPPSAPFSENTLHFQRCLQEQVSKVHFQTRPDRSLLVRVESETQSQAMSNLLTPSGDPFCATPDVHWHYFHLPSGLSY